MINTIFEQLAATPKRTEKLEILEANRNNEVLKAVFLAALDPYVAYNIRKIPKYTPQAGMNLLDMSTFINTLSEFSTRQVTGNAAIERLANLLEQLPPEEAVIAERIIKKDLRCGIQESTVNKVWKNLVPTYPCLLGKPYDEKSIQRIEYPAYSQTKADGMRANALIHKRGEDVVEFRGRSGKIIDILGTLDEDLLRFAEFQSAIIMDGELIVVDENGKTLPRKIGNGILNKAIKGTISEEEVSRVRFRVWDIIPHEDFLKKQYAVPYMARFRRLEHNMWVNGTERVSLIPYCVVNSFEEAWEHYQDMIMAGEEGTMIKNFNHIWEDKRSPDLVKLKAEEECDLEVISWNPGTPGTKLENKMGSLVCASSDRKVEVSISGFTDELRDEITEDIQNWMGVILTVKYNERIASKDKNRADVDSLFLPRYEERRYDKSVADASKDIK